MKVPEKLFFSLLVLGININEHGFRRFKISNKVFLIKGLIQLLAYYASAQGIGNSQFYNTTLTLNPAMAAYENCPTVQLNFSIQKNNLADDFSSYQTAFIYPLYANKENNFLETMKGALAANVMYDVSGPNRSFSSTQIGASYAYLLILDRMKMQNLSFSIGANYYNTSVNTDELHWGQQFFDQNAIVHENTLLNTSNAFDFNFGMFWFYHNRHQSRNIKAANIGLAIDHLNRPDLSFTKKEKVSNKLEFRLHGSIIMNLNHADNFSLNTLLSKQGNVHYANIGTYFSHQMLYQNEYIFIARLGLWYRFKESFIALIEFETDKVKLAFSIDMNDNFAANQITNSTFQIHLDFRINNRKTRNTRY